MCNKSHFGDFWFGGPNLAFCGASGYYSVIYVRFG